MKCKICSAQSVLFARDTILNKYAVSYFKCDSCGFIQTEEPYWLDESYSRPINNSDVGLVSRNLNFAGIAAVLISAFFKGSGKFIDYGGGYGLFVRLMRDRGFDFYRTDAYCENLFAGDFEGCLKKNERYEMVTAFEVFEHLADPLPEIEKMLSFSDTILFSTDLVPKKTPMPSEWPYYALEHGQHISFYTCESLVKIAEKFKLKVYSNGSTLHLLTTKTLIPWLFSALSGYRVARIAGLFLPRHSLLQEDYHNAVQRQKDASHR